MNMKSFYHVTNIQWDTDGRKEKLPQSFLVLVPQNEDVVEFLSDYITEHTGFCHKGFSHEFAKYETAIDNFLTKLKQREDVWNKIECEKNNWVEHRNKTEFSFESATKYDKVFRKSWGQKSIYCFINKATGGIIKAATWKAPEPKKYERGNIYNDDCLKGTERYGVVYYK